MLTGLSIIDLYSWKTNITTSIKAEHKTNLSKHKNMLFEYTKSEFAIIWIVFNVVSYLEMLYFLLLKRRFDSYQNVINVIKIFLYFM